ncbi:hypothetical protein UlMin_040857 [Ulmus minor]
MSSDLIGKLETDVEIEALATKFHDIFMKRPHHISNVSSEKIQGCELHKGEWELSVLSFIGITITVNGKPRVAKEVVEVVDEEKNLITFKITACVVHWILEYEKKHAKIVDPHTLLEFAADVSKDIEEHLLEA